MAYKIGEEVWFWDRGPCFDRGQIVGIEQQERENDVEINYKLIVERHSFEVIKRAECCDTSLNDLIMRILPGAIVRSAEMIRTATNTLDEMRELLEKAKNETAGVE